MHRIAGKFGGGEVWRIVQDHEYEYIFANLKPSKLVLTINNLLANLFAKCSKRLNSPYFPPPNFPGLP